MGKKRLFLKKNRNNLGNCFNFLSNFVGKRRFEQQSQNLSSSKQHPTPTCINSVTNKFEKAIDQTSPTNLKNNWPKISNHHVLRNAIKPLEYYYHYRYNILLQAVIVLKAKHKNFIRLANNFSYLHFFFCSVSNEGKNKITNLASLHNSILIFKTTFDT